MILFFDTETTGIPEFRKPSADPCQPYIVSLSAVLRGDKTETMMDKIIKPEGWTIPDEVAAIHGITTERAMDEGVPINDALDEFFALVQQACETCGHNLSFDKRLLRIAEKRRYGEEKPNEELPIGFRLSKLTTLDTQLCMTPICNLPPTEKMLAVGRNHPKAPKLSEAYAHAFNKPLEKAHTSIADVRGCIELYDWLVSQGHIETHKERTIA